MEPFPQDDRIGKHSEHILGTLNQVNDWNKATAHLRTIWWQV